MIKKLTLENFKNFKKAELELGPFTLLVGANATGKSNIRDAFRFLNGIGRGYTIPEIIGEKYISGERVWRGIRGGTQEISNPADKGFSLYVDITESYQSTISNAYYHFAVVMTDKDNRLLQILFEYLGFSGQKPLFNWSLKEDNMHWADFLLNEKHLGYPIRNPIIQLIETGKIDPSDDNFLQKKLIEEFGTNVLIDLKSLSKTIIGAFRSMRFLDLDADALRMPSFPGQNVLGDRGENLSTVLYDICQDKQKKRILVEWIRELTPMDASDFEFVPDQVGRILVTLVEKNGRKTSAYSASDGTLRFLGILAALMGPDPTKLYFFEEIENGIHPGRLHLLLELIEQVTSEGKIQVVATTHSPQLLGLVSEQTLENASLTYRLEGEPDAHIQRIVDIPNAREIFKEEDLSRLYERGWLENSVHFMKNGKKSA